jgi:DNA-binding IclR family transcriptional regulator
MASKPGKPQRKISQQGADDRADAMSEAAGDERYLVPALVRGFNVLRTLSERRASLTLSEVATALDVTRSSAFRLLYTLEHLGYVESDPATKSYRLGPQVLSLGYGYLASRYLVEVAMPHLVRMRDRTGWSAHLGELQGRDVVYLARVPTRRSVASNIHVGTRLPARATTMGRILLSALPEDEVRALFASERTAALDGQPVADVEGLIRQLRTDRANGVVVQNSGYEPGVASVAAPVFDMSSRLVAAINISAVAMFSSEAELNGPLKAEVVACAAAISRSLGYRADRSDAETVSPQASAG